MTRSMRVMPPLLALVAIIFSSSAYAAATYVRGVDPSLVDRYVAKDGKFQCLDGSKTIQFSQVNDNYCDCMDGSDEPGTSACPNGKFYCANRGYQAASISTSFVDDGFCDCCDGADEPLGTCRNSCIQRGEALKQVLLDEIDKLTRALETKEARSNEAKSARQNWALRLETIETDLEAKRAALEEAKAYKQRVDAEDAEKRRIHDEEQAAKSAEEAAKAAEEAAKAAEEAAVAEAAATAAAIEAAARLAAKTAEKVAEAAATAAASKAQEAVQVDAEETEEERGRRIASQWTNDPDAAGEAEELQEVPDATAFDYEASEHADYTPDYGAGDQDWDRDEDEDDDDLVEEHKQHDHQSHHHHHHHHHHAHSHSTYRVDPEVHVANGKVRTAEADLKKIEKEKEELHRWALSPKPIDFGPHDLWIGLAGRKFTQYVSSQHKTFEMVMFGNATQVLWGQRTNLGAWAGFSEDFSSATFLGGEPCDTAGERTMTIHFECGAAEKMVDTAEHQTCQFQTTLITPLACNPLEKEEAEKELQALEEEQRAVAEEIAAGEAELRRTHPHLFHDEL